MCFSAFKKLISKETNLVIQYIVNLNIIQTLFSEKQKHGQKQSARERLSGRYLNPENTSAQERRQVGPLCAWLGDWWLSERCVSLTTCSMIVVMANMEPLLPSCSTHLMTESVLIQKLCWEFQTWAWKTSEIRKLDWFVIYYFNLPFGNNGGTQSLSALGESLSIKNHHGTAKNKKTLIIGYNYSYCCYLQWVLQVNLPF